MASLASALSAEAAEASPRLAEDRDLVEDRDLRDLFLPLAGGTKAKSAAQFM